MNGKTFIKVTNNMLYDEIKKLEEQINELKTCHLENENNIKITKWIASSALGLATFIGGCMLTNILKNGI